MFQDSYVKHEGIMELDIVKMIKNENNLEEDLISIFITHSLRLFLKGVRFHLHEYQ